MNPRSTSVDTSLTRTCWPTSSPRGPDSSPAFGRRRDDADPHVGLRTAGDDGVVLLADMGFEHQRGLGFAHPPLDLLGGIFLRGAVFGECLQLGHAVLSEVRSVDRRSGSIANTRAEV